MQLPSLIAETGKPLGEGLLLAVHAPFGTDETLSSFPDGLSTNVEQHPLVQSLVQVAATGVHVVALIDRVGDDTWLLDIPGGQPAAMKLVSRWKQDMSSPRNLAGFLEEAHRRYPAAPLVLALEGHGAGYLPEIDRRQLTPSNVTEGGKYEWQYSDKEAAPVLPGGYPILPGGYPILPGGYPILPVNHLPMSTYGLGLALKLARDRGVPMASVIHFDNCFNMSVELLHTVAPFADYATGYNNYNFFTAGASYPKVFQALQSAGSATAHQLAQWFADEQHAHLQTMDAHPIVAGVVQLSRMEGIAQGIDALSDALLVALRNASPADRPALLDLIQKAIEASQQYDSEPGWELETPDQLTDICSFADRLMQYAGGLPAVQSAAADLVKLLDGIKRHGDKDVPWMDATGQIVWDFTERTLAMNIFLPDPLRTGQWDWRSTYYVDVNPDPAKPLVQPGVIEFLKATNWVEFLVEYHKDVPFKAFHVGSIPMLPPSRGKGEYGGKPSDYTLPSPKPRLRWPLGRLGLRVAEWLQRGGGGTTG